MSTVAYIYVAFTTGLFWCYVGFVWRAWLNPNARMYAKGELMLHTYVLGPIVGALVIGLWLMASTI